LLGLYDSQGVLRYAGRDQADCLAYVELFGLEEGTYSLEPLALLVMDRADSAGLVAARTL
jgi:hypothetical protein